MRLRMLSFKAKIALAMSLMFLVVAMIIDLVVVTYFQQYLHRAIVQQQSSFVEQVARQIEQDVHEARGLLAFEANSVTPRLLERPEAAHIFLVNRRSLQTVFDHGLYLLDVRGRLVADSREESPLEPGTDFSNLPYIERTLREEKPLISSPYRSYAGDYHPVVTFTAPVMNAAGEICGILAGGLDLTRDNILTRPAGIRIGREGYLGVYTEEGIAVTHSFREQILANLLSDPLPKPGTGAGAEGATEMVDWRGVSVLQCTRRLQFAPWILAASYPTDELYAPLADARRISHLIVAIGALFTVLLTLVVVQVLTQSLTRLTSQVAGIGREREPGRRVVVEGTDEVGRLAGAINSMLEALAQTQQQLQSLASELSIAEERERRRMASDLHDSICQTLAFTALQISQVQGATKDPLLIRRLEEIRRLIEQAVTDMRSLIFDLSPPILYELGLVPALEWVAEQFESQYGLEVSIEDDGQEKPLPSELRIFLFRAVRELLTNVAKHAGARQTTVHLERTGTHIRITVADTGKGFDPADLEERADRPQRFGLFSIRERLLYFGGALQIDSLPGRGTRAVLLAPLGGGG